MWELWRSTELCCAFSFKFLFFFPFCFFSFFFLFPFFPLNLILLASASFCRSQASPHQFLPCFNFISPLNCPGHHFDSLRPSEGERNFSHGGMTPLTEERKIALTSPFLARTVQPRCSLWSYYASYLCVSVFDEHRCWERENNMSRRDILSVCLTDCLPLLEDSNPARS